MVSALTESQSVGAARLQNEGQDGDGRQQTAWYDVVDDVVQRQTSKIKTELDSPMSAGYVAVFRHVRSCEQKTYYPVSSPPAPTRHFTLVIVWANVYRFPIFKIILLSDYQVNVVCAHHKQFPPDFKRVAALVCET